MLYDFLFLSLPSLSFLVFQQLHLVPSQIFASLFFLIVIFYSIKSEAIIKNAFFKTAYTCFIKGSAITLALITMIIAFPIGGYLTKPLILPQSTEKAEAAVVLASGVTSAGEPGLSLYQRVIHGAELLKKGQTEHLYISTGFSAISQFTEYNAVASLTQLLAIPKNKVTILKSSEITTTDTEAKYIKKYLEAKGINKILLTTSNSHIYRSYLTFTKVGFQVLPAPCHTKETTLYAAENLSLFKAAVHEWIGLAWYWLKGKI